MTDTPSPITPEQARAAWLAELATLTPDEQKRIVYALDDMVPFLFEFAEGIAHPWFAKVPFGLGKTIEGMVDNYANAQEPKVLAFLVPDPSAS